VKGVILHVDSPGGSALASDLMHHEIEQLAREKPLVVCMGNVAASGGYYVAAPAACIVARPTTVTGSIGVVAARFSIEALLTRLGVSTEVVEKGRRAALASPSGPLDDDARSAVQRELDATYRAFVGVVASGRKMQEADVERAARGRVYTGADALEAKLVDVLGGFETALEEVKRRLAVSVRERVQVRLVRPPRQPLPALEPPPAKEAVWSFALSLLPAHERVVAELAVSGERVLALAPIVDT
jgi:protease-4